MNEKDTQTLTLPPGVRLLARLLGGRRHSHRIAWSLSGDLIAAAYSSGRVCLWRAPHPKALTVIDQREPIYSLAFSPDGSRLMYAGASGRIYQIDLASSEPIPPIRGHLQPIWGLAYTPDGLSFATGSDDGTVKLWNLARGQWNARTVVRSPGTQF